jgi:hypothetical protein
VIGDLPLGAAQRAGSISPPFHIARIIGTALSGKNRSEPRRTARHERHAGMFQNWLRFDEQQL